MGRLGTAVDVHRCSGDADESLDKARLRPPGTGVPRTSDAPCVLRAYVHNGKNHAGPDFRTEWSSETGIHGRLHPGANLDCRCLPFPISAIFPMRNKSLDTPHLLS